jgi:hypothetical protein
MVSRFDAPQERMLLLPRHVRSESGECSTGVSRKVALSAMRSFYDQS